MSQTATTEAATNRDVAIRIQQRAGYELQWIDPRDGQACLSRNRGGSISLIYIERDGFTHGHMFE